MESTSAEPLRYPDARGRSLEDVVREAPSGATIVLAPGRHAIRLRIDRPIVLRGAGELTRLSGYGSEPSVLIEAEPDELVRLEALALFGDGERPVLEVRGGKVELENVRLSDGAADRGGGLLVLGGSVEGSRVRIDRCRARQGGAVAVCGEASLALSESWLGHSEAWVGGALLAEGAAVVALRTTDIERVRCTGQASGQVMQLVARGPSEPRVWLQRVRFRDPPSGHPVAVEGHAKAHMTVVACELPRLLRDLPGVTEYGRETRWR